MHIAVAYIISIIIVALSIYAFWNGFSFKIEFEQRGMKKFFKPRNKYQLVELTKEEIVEKAVEIMVFEDYKKAHIKLRRYDSEILISALELIGDRQGKNIKFVKDLLENRKYNI